MQTTTAKVLIGDVAGFLSGAFGLLLKYEQNVNYSALQRGLISRMWRNYADSRKLFPSRRVWVKMCGTSSQGHCFTTQSICFERLAREISLQLSRNQLCQKKERVGL